MADEIIDLATGQPEKQDEIIDIGTGQPEQPTGGSQGQQVKQPLPYLNWLPGGKELNQGLMQSQQTLEDLHPGMTEANKGQQFLKQMGGSVMAGLGAESAAGLIPGLASKAMIPSMARAAIGGAAAAQPFDYNSLADRGMSTVGGAALGAALPPVIEATQLMGKFGSKIPEFMKGIADRNAVKSGTGIQEGVRDLVNSKFLGKTKSFDAELSNLPDATHDVTDIVNSLKQKAELNPAIKDAIENSPIAKKLIYGDASGAGKILDAQGRPLAEQVADQSNKVVDTKTLQNLRNELGKRFDYINPKHDWQLGSVLSDLRLKQAEPFPKEMGKIATDYKDTINNYKAVRQRLSPANLGNNLLKGFGGEGGAELRKSLDYFLGPKSQSIRNIYESGEKLKTLKEIGKDVGLGAGLTGVGAYELLKK